MISSSLFEFKINNALACQEIWEKLEHYSTQLLLTEEEQPDVLQRITSHPMWPRIKQDFEQWADVISELRGIFAEHGREIFTYLTRKAAGVGMTALRGGYTAGKFVGHEVLSLLKFLFYHVPFNVGAFLYKTVKLMGCLEAAVSGRPIQCADMVQDWRDSLVDFAKLPVTAAMFGTGPPLVLSYVGREMGPEESHAMFDALATLWKAVGIMMVVTVNRWAIPTATDEAAPAKVKKAASILAGAVPRSMRHIKEELFDRHIKSEYSNRYISF